MKWGASKRPRSLMAFLPALPVPCCSISLTRATTKLSQRKSCALQRVSAAKCTIHTPDPRTESQAAKRTTTPQSGSITSTRREEQNSRASNAFPQLSPSLSLFVLNFVTVLWGTQHAVIKSTLDTLSPQSLNLLRFSLATLLSLPALPRPTSENWATYKSGLELSLYLFLGYALQAQSLLTTSASRSGFLLYLNVKFVPILARVLYGRRISWLTWSSAALALTGTLLLTWDGTPPNVGDVGSVGAAAASAMFILRLERAAQQAAGAVNAVALLGVSLLCGVWYALSPDTRLFPDSGSGVVAVLYLGIVTTALSNYLQTVAQRVVSAERAAVVFALDPVYGALFAATWLGERIGSQGLIGAGVIVFAAMLSNWGVVTRIKKGKDGSASGGGSDEKQ